MKFKPFLFALYLTILFSSTSIAQNTYVPDDNFEQALVDLGYDPGPLNDSVPTDSINSVTELNVAGKGILSLTGIESFAALSELNFSNNLIPTVDFSFNNNLVVLSCYNNLLSALDFSANTIIETINCSNNQLTDLNLSLNTSLKYLNCSSNQLTSLNLKNGNNHLMTGDNYQITGIDIRDNTKLYCIQVDNLEASNTYTTWYRNPWNEYTNNCNSYVVEMTYVPDDNFEQELINMGYDTGVLNDSVSTYAIKNVSYLNLPNKNISDLTGIESFTNLWHLYCDNNQLTSLELQNNTKLIYLVCRYNNLTTLDLSSNTLLAQLFCDNNNIIDLDFSNNTFLTKLYCQSNQLTSLSVRNGNNNNLYLDATNNPNLFCIEVDDITVAENTNWIKHLYTAYSEDCSNHKIEMTYVPDDNFEQALIIRGLDFDNNLNDSVPTVGFKTLSSLYIRNKSINDLTGIEAFTNLSRLYCEDNQLTELDISSNTKLQTLHCFNNHIVNLDLRENNQLTALNASNNKITGLNLQNGNNEILQISVRNNPNLFCIQVDDPTASEGYSNWYKDATTSYSENCGLLGAGIPLSEYNSLEDLFNSTVGLEWINNINWLDTTTASVSDWYGITVEDGHVTKIELSNNNLQEEVFSSVVNLSELQILDLSNNELLAANFSNLSETIQLTTLKIENNNFVFKHIKPVFDLAYFSELNSGFTYSPQAKFGSSENVEKSAGSDHTFEISVDYLSENNQYQWYMYPTTLLDGKTSSYLEFSPISKADSGTYYLEITNADVPELTLQSNYKTLYVSQAKGAGIPKSEYTALVDFYNSMNGNSWINNDNWLDTINYTVDDWYGVWVESSHVVELGFNNNKLEGTIPSSITNLNHLKKFYSNKNNINGKISNDLITIPTLTNVGIRESNLTDSFNDIIENSKDSLQYLSLELNNIYGTIPTDIGNTSLTELWITGNNINGTIPSSIGNLNNLFVFYAADNKISGTIPAALGNITGIQTVILSNNQIEGPLPIELKKLVNLEDFVLDNNLIGKQITNDSTQIIKSTPTNYARQIPDELSNLISLSQLQIDNNNLMFNDIEAIFSWENFNEINDFIYSPQSKIGTEKTISVEEDESIILSVDNHYPGNSDTYQWYKNEELIEMATSKDLLIENVTKEDAGNYHCIISNPVAKNLILTSKSISLVVEDKQSNSRVPQKEYLALENIYNKFGNANWGENWLDTVTSVIGDWSGVTVENEHVIAIDLSSLNIEGAIFDIFSAFDSLKWLNLSNNNISGRFPTFSDSKSTDIKSVTENGYNLSYLNIANNNFIFSDFDPVAQELLAIDTFIYSPQQLIGIPIDTSMFKYQSLSIEIAGYKSGENDYSKWFKNGEVQPVSTPIFEIENASFQESGIYVMTVQNNTFPELTLESETYELSVYSPVGIAESEEIDVNLFPNPTDEKIYFEFQNKKANLKILDIAGKLIHENVYYQSTWIDISQFPKGIYLFRMEFENSQIMYRKIVFK